MLSIDIPVNDNIPEIKTPVVIQSHTNSSSTNYDQKLESKNIISDTPLKIIIVGDSRVGKTSFVNIFTNKKFTYEHKPTVGVEINTISFKSSASGTQSVFNGKDGFVKLELWDCAGDKNMKGLDDGYYIGAHGAIIMVDQTDSSSIYSIPSYIKNISRICHNIPIVICRNKEDRNINQKISIKCNIINKTRRKYFDISVKNLYHCDVPFIHILQSINKEYRTMNVAIKSSRIDWIKKSEEWQYPPPKPVAIPISVLVDIHRIENTNIPEKVQYKGLSEDTHNDIFANVEITPYNNQGVDNGYHDTKDKSVRYSLFPCFETCNII